MKQDPLPNHERYRPSGRLNIGLFALLLLPLFCTALGLAWLLDFLFPLGFYFVFFTPIILALPLLGALAGFVIISKCRAPALATLLALCMGLLFFIGHFHFGYIRETGLQAALQVDRLPAYILHRLHTDSSSESERKPNRVNFGLNIFRFLIELGVILFLCMLATRARSCRPFCEHCKRWSRAEKADLSLAGKGALLDALATGDFSHTAELRAVPAGPTEDHVRITLYTCPELQQCCPAPSFLSIETIVAGSGIQANTEQAKRNQRLARIQLSARESAEFAAIFEDNSPESTAGNSSGPAAQIDPIRARDANQLLNTHFQLTTLAWSVGMPFVLIISGILTMTILEPIALIIGSILLVAGVALLLLHEYMFKRRSLKRLEQAFGRHRRSVVDPADSQAIVAEIIPRKNWRLMLNTADDIGYLRIDTHAGEVRFEGDRERMRIPAAAILSRDALDATIGNSHFSLAAIRVQTADGPRELPFYPQALRNMGALKRAALRDELLADFRALTGDQ